MPHTGATNIIVTSNAPNWNGVAAAVEVEKWPEEIGADYLVAQAGRPRERNTALALSEALDGLPLAHEQAAAYCARTGLSLADYRKKFEAEPTKFLDAEKDASPGYHNRRTAAKTFALAIDEAAKLHPAAEPLIVYVALLAPEPIPLYFFLETAERFGETFASAIAADGLDEAVAALRAFALIDRETISDERDPSITTDCIRLHRLVRQVASARRGDEAREEALHALVVAMTKVYPANVFYDPWTWPRARRLDAIAMALAADNLARSDKTETAIGSLLNQLAQYRQASLAAYEQARPLYERTLAIIEKSAGPDHPNTAVVLNNLGFLLKLQGDLAGASSRYLRALEIDEKNYGPDHLEVATDLNNLGTLATAQGDYASAQSHLECALAIREKALGPDDVEVGRILNNLGHLSHTQGNLARAKTCLDRALTIREKALDPNHPEIASTLNNLAAVLRQQGNLVAAQSYCERALTIDLKTLGPAHPSTQAVVRNAAIVLQERGRTKEAEALRQKFGIKD